MKALINIINPKTNPLVLLLYINFLLFLLSLLSILRTDISIVIVISSIFLYWLYYLIKQKYSKKKIVLLFLSSFVLTPIIPLLATDKKARTRMNPSKSSFAVVVYLVILVVVLDYFTVNNNVYSGIFGYLERSIEKFKYNARGIKKVSNSVTIIDMDDSTLDKYGWPIDRRKLSNVVLKLKKMGAKAVAFDMVFTDPSNNESIKTSKELYNKFQKISLTSNGNIIKKLNELIKQKELELEKIKKRLYQSKKTIKKLETTRKTFSKKIQNKTRKEIKLLKRLKNNVYKTKKIIATMEENIKQYRITFNDLKSKNKEYLDFLNKKSNEISPDKIFAKAIKKAGNVILGYVGYSFGSQEANISEKRKRENFNSVISRAEVKLIEGDLSDNVSFAEFEALNSPYKDIVWAEKPLPKKLVDEINKKIDNAKDEIPEELMDMLDRAEGILATDNFGSFNLIADVDGIARNYYPAYIIKDKQKKNHILFSLGLAALKVFYQDKNQKTDTFKLRYEVNGVPELGYYFDFSNKKKLKLEADTPYLVLNYYGPRNTFKYISMKTILMDKLSQKDIKKYIDGKIILFGTTAIGLLDLRSSPYNPSQAYPGVEVHATFIENILDGSYFKRPYYFLPVELIFLVFIVIFLGILFSYLKIYINFIITILATYIIFLIDVKFFFSHGYLLYILIHLLTPSIMFLTITIFRYFSEEKEKQMVKKTFKYYLSQSVVDEVLKDPSKLALGGVKKNISVLFSDIRGFTTISEGLTPDQLSVVMNDYLTPMTQCVFDYEGTLDKYMGDAIMAFFGAPIKQDDHAMRACLTALKMMDELKILAEEFKARSLPIIDIGIGVNSGDMSVGNMGSKQRFDYTVMGDNVNLGSRLEGINKQYKTNIIISEYTYELVKDSLLCRKLDAVKVKGKNEPVVIYQLLSKHKHNTELLKISDLTNQGIQYYWDRNWDKSIAIFNKILEIKANDYLSEKYIDRCKHFKETPPEANWDGSFKMTTK